jgi:signal transduction histidine kinase
MLSRHLVQILEPLARGEDLARILTLICSTIESEKSRTQVRASVVLYDAVNNCIRLGAAPSLPDEYCRAIEGASPGPAAGSCGTAIYRREPVIVRDIASDPLWTEHRQLALDYSLRACWSCPIIGKDNSVLGAFALYYPKPRRPSSREIREIGEFALIAGLAIERAQVEKERAARAAILATMVENLNQGVAIFDSDHRLARYNQLYEKFYRFPPGFLHTGLGYDDIIRFLAERGDYGAVDVDGFVTKRMVELDTTPEWRNLRHQPDSTSIAIYRRTLPNGGLICTFTDITPEVRATVESHRNAQLLAATLDNANIGIRVIDGTGHLALCNQRYREIFDLPEQVTQPGTPYAELLRYTLPHHITNTGDMDAHVRVRLNEVKSISSSSHITETVSGKVLHVTRDPMPDGGMVTTYADVSHIRRTERELEEKSALLETSLDNMDQGLLLFDADLNLELVNRAYLRLFGFTTEQIKPGMNYSEVLRRLVERGDYPGENGEEVIHRRIADARARRFQRSLHHRSDGTIISVYRKPVPDGGFAITFTDVTNEVRAGEEAKTKSNLLQMTQDYMAQGICVMDENLRITNFNQRWVELFDLPPEIARPGILLRDNLRYRAMRGDFGPGDIEELVQARLSRLNPGKPLRLERLTRSTGRVVSIEYTPVPHGGFISTYTDVTERWKAERELERKSQLLEATVESVSQGIAVYDADFTLVSRNRQYGEMLGFEAGFPALGTSYDDVIRRVSAEGSFGDRNADDVVSEFRETIEATPQSTLEHTTSDGKNMIVYRSRMPNGGFVITLTDVTRMRKAEHDAAEKTHLLELALANMSQGIAIHDGELRLVAFNEKYLALRGDLPADLIKPGMPHEETIRYRAKRGDYGPGDVEELVRERMEKMRRGDTYAPTRVVNRKIIQVQREPMPDGGFVTTYTDITGLKQVEAELIHARDSAQAANRAKTQFLANMSHELRTPLNAIIGFSEIMRSEVYGPLGEPRYTEYINSIADSGTHLLSLINDILDLSKIEVGEITLVESDVDLGNLIESCLSLVRDKALSKSISMESVVADGLPPVRADARLLKQVLLNLLQNAIKFTAADGQVRTGAALTADAGVQITVADTGIGIKEEDIPRAFERFGQVDSDLSRQYNGAGLGLPLAKSFTELHGGTLSISSKVNHGTIVTVLLPADRVRPRSERGGKRPRQSA